MLLKKLPTVFILLLNVGCASILLPGRKEASTQHKIDYSVIAFEIAINYFSPTLGLVSLAVDSYNHTIFKPVTEIKYQEVKKEKPKSDDSKDKKSEKNNDKKPKSDDSKGKSADQSKNKESKSDDSKGKSAKQNNQDTIITIQ